MIRRTFAPVLATLGLLPIPFLAHARAAGVHAEDPLGSPAATQDQGKDAPDSAHAAEVEGLVQREVENAPNLAVGDIWNRALEVRGLAQLGGEEALDRALDSLLARPDKLSPHAALLVASARLQGDRPQPIPLANALVPLLDSDDPGIADGTASLLSDSIFRGLTRARDGLGEKLLAEANDASKSAAHRLRFAATLHAIGTGDEGRAARGVILSFLDSQDPDLRAQGAITLAGLRGEPIEGPLRDELEQLQRIPGDRGELADQILKRAREKEFFERRISDQRDKYESGKLPSELQEFASVLHMIEARHLEGNLVTREQLVEAAMDGMLHYMDAHSTFLSSEDYAKFFQDLEAEYGGIGAYVDIDPDDGLFTIQRPIYSGPAYKAGIKTGDKIVRIDNWPTLGKDRDEIIKRLKGKPGSKVTLYIWQRGMDADKIDRPTDDMKVELERALIEIPAGSYQMLPGKIGMIELTTFSRVAMEEVKGWLTNMQKDGMKALILDLRRNPGGLLTEAREVAELFLPRGSIVVSTEGRGEEPRPLRTRVDPILSPDIPIIIVTGRFTASAAEIVSGALQDHGRATLVGERTYGKGSVQQLLPVEGAEEDEWDDVNKNGRWDSWEPITKDINGNGQVDYAPRVKLTIARYLLPSGRSIHRLLNREGEVLQEGGVMPDDVVAMPSIERWRFEERRRIQNLPVLQDYVKEHYASDPKLFDALAVNDQRNPESYPDFDTLMAKLDTTLPRDDVRSVLRSVVRRTVQDDRGAEFPFGDFVEDVQIQKAIEVALGKLGEKPDDIAVYSEIFQREKELEEPQHGAVAALGPQRLDGLSRARDLIEHWRDELNANAVISDDEVKEVLGILEGAISDH